MGLTTVQLYDSLGYAKLDPYCLYAAFAPVDDNMAFIKVGISSFPLRRIYAVHCGSPVGIEQALWAHVGSSGQARKIERFIHKRLNPYRSRGEWFEMDMTSKEQKTLFHWTCKIAYGRITGRALTWRKISINEIRAVLGIEGFTVGSK